MRFVFTFSAGYNKLFKEMFSKIFRLRLMDITTKVDDFNSFLESRK